jgi:cell division protein FtsW
VRTQNFLSKPISSYYLLLVSTASLTSLGLVMVLSASSIHSLEANGSSFAIVARQLVFLILALPVGYVASRLPLERWISISRYSLIGSALILMIVQIPGIGHSVGGNRNWVGYGPVVIQPSEFVKFFLVLWAGYMLSRYESKGTGSGNVIKLLLPAFLSIMLLILGGRDLGTAAVFGAILVGLLFVSGIKLRLLGITSIIGVSAIVGMIITVPQRMSRLLAVLEPFSPEYYKLAGWQPAHSIMGLASGGLYGVGLGASRQKWGNLPEAHTDFIFSVIGEELGLLGTLAVLLLLSALIYSIFKIAIRAQDPMTRYVCAGIGCWILIQTVMNIGSATSVLPVVGVTLPLVSYGGSSLFATILALGYVLGAARRDPSISEVLKSGRS